MATEKLDGNRSYEKNAEMFRMKKGECKPYSEYKKTKSNEVTPKSWTG